MMIFKPDQADEFELLDGPPLTPPEGDAIMFRGPNGQLLVIDDVGVVRDPTEADMVAAINGFALRIRHEFSLP